MRIFNFFLFLGFLFICCGFLHFIIELWQALPLKEEKSTPVYITKEIKEG